MSQRELTQAEIDNYAVRKMLSDELKKMRCHALARRVASGEDQNPRLLAAIAVVKKLAGLA